MATHSVLSHCAFAILRAQQCLIEMRACTVYPITYHREWIHWHYTLPVFYVITIRETSFRTSVIIQTQVLNKMVLLRNPSRAPFWHRSACTHHYLKITGRKPFRYLSYPTSHYALVFTIASNRSLISLL